MVLGTKTDSKKPRVKAWIIREEADRVFNDPEFSDFMDIDYPYIFMTPKDLNTWMAAVFKASPEEWDMSYNEFEEYRLLEMEPGDKYELYVYANSNSMWSKQRNGYVVAI